MKQRKNGFTLIELLAVIVILAIIALIATPIILNIIEKARKSAFVDSAYGLIEAAKLDYTEGLLQNTSTAKSYIFPQNGTDRLEFSGSEPKGGTINVSGSGKVALAIHNGTWCAIKGENDSQVTISNYDVETCVLPEEVVAYTPEKCFTFDFSTGTITKYKKSDSDCGVDVVIPETIGGVTVKVIGSYAFVENWDGDTNNKPTTGDTKKINSVVFPSGLESIEFDAFEGKFYFWDSETENSGEYQFNQITSLDFSKATNLTTIGELAFVNNQLINVDLSNLMRLTAIRDSAFYGNQLTDVAFGSINMLEIISYGAFCNRDGTVPAYDVIPSSVIENEGFNCGR